MFFWSIWALVSLNIFCLAFILIFIFSSKNLKRHFEVHHSKLDKWVCVKCYENSQEPTYFSNADKLDEHVRHNHENVGLFVCVVEGCEEIFACSGHAFSHFYNKHNSRSKGKKRKKERA